MRSFENTWHDCVIGEIELGSRDAYVAMACDYDVGLSNIAIWMLFENDYRAEQGLPPTNDTPWGPYDWTDEMLAEDEEQARNAAEALENRALDHHLRRRS